MHFAGLANFTLLILINYWLTVLVELSAAKAMESRLTHGLANWPLTPSYLGPPAEGTESRLINLWLGPGLRCFMLCDGMIASGYFSCSLGRLRRIFGSEAALGMSELI